MIPDEIIRIIRAVCHHDRNGVAGRRDRALRERRDRTHADGANARSEPEDRPRDRLDGGDGPVDRAVVDDDHLVLDARARKRGDDAGDRRGDRALLVVRGNDDGELHANTVRRSW